MTYDVRRPRSPGRTETSARREPATWRRLAVRLAGLVLATTGALVLPSGHAAASDVPVPAPVQVAAVEEYLRDQLDETSIPGAAVAVTHRDEVLLVRGYGQDSRGAPVTGDTLFRIASLSKSFTSLALLQLVDAGRLSLDDPVVQHLPEFRVADPRGARITVRQVLDHTSGLADRAFSELDRRQPSSLSEAVASLSAAHLVAEPGTRWNYHNPNSHIAARLVEVLSGQQFDDYLREHVFAPAGMESSTTVVQSDDPVAGLARGHVTAYGRALAAEGLGTFEAGAGGVVSTAADMADWLIVHANGGRAAGGARLVSESGLTEMHTGRAPVGYALGWDTDGPLHAPTRLTHSGNLLTYSAFQAVLPGSGYGVALLLNSGSAFLLEESQLFEGLLDVLDGDPGASARGLRFSAALRDAVLGSATVIVLLLGTRGVLASRRWVTRHGRSGARATLRMVPLLGVLAVVAAFPRIAELLYGGRDVSWAGAAYGWPALVVLVGTALVAAIATLTARLAQLPRRFPTGLPRRRESIGGAARAHHATSRPSS